MEYKCDKKDYRTFLCYRRKEKNPAFAASENVAGMIHWWLNYDPEFKAGKNNALFEECYPETEDGTFGSDGIREFMQYMNSIFVVVCPEFFQRILKTYNGVLRQERGLSQEEQVEKTRQLLSGSKQDICYLEIRHALERGLSIKPVFVDNNGMHFDYGLDADEKNDLKEIFGDGGEILFKKINGHTLDYAAVASELEGIVWQDVEEKEVRERMTRLERDPAVRALREFVKKCCLGETAQKPSRKTADDVNDIITDLRLCATTFYEQQRPRPGERYFCATNEEIIYDPVRMYHKKGELKPPFLAACLVEDFMKNKEKFRLETDNFCYWNVEMDPDAEDPTRERATTAENSVCLSVCAVCFGLLCTNHRLYKDSQLVDGGELKEKSRRALLDTIRSGMNLLLALRNPYTKTWPSSWEFNNSGSSVGVEGTTNQTTLSLSTLMSCGFLATDGGVAPEALKARYGYIQESIQALLRWKKEGMTYEHEECVGWCYTENSVKHGHAAVLPTVFALDTLGKLQQNIFRLKEFFREDEAFCRQLEEDLEVAEKYLVRIIRFFQNEQDSDTGAFKRYEDWELSVTHTAYVVKSLYQYGNLHPQAWEELTQILDPAVSYLINTTAQMLENGEMSFQMHERFENFCDKRRNNESNTLLKSTFGELYEHCAELLVAEGLIKIAENAEDRETVCKAMDLLHKIFEIYYADEKTILRDHDSIYIRSARTEGLKYPIYYLYYYRMFLLDYLSLLKKTEE